MNIFRSLMFVVLLCFGFGIKAEELEQSQEVVEGEEVTNRIFDTWQEGEEMGVCSLPENEVIERTKHGDTTCLETYVRNRDITNASQERDSIGVFLKIRTERAQQSCKNNEEWVFLDEQTRCTCIRDKAPIKCVSIFTNKEFKEKKLLNNKKERQ